MIICRALVEIFSHPILAENLAFRGGTALYRLHLAPVRYSEDIDLVQVHPGPVSRAICVIPFARAISPHSGRYQRGVAFFECGFQIRGISKPPEAVIDNRERLTDNVRKYNDYKEGLPKRYWFKFLTPADYDDFFQELRKGSYKHWRSELMYLPG